MSSMKSFTSLEQSKKLAKFLLLESADMYYFLDPTPAGNIYHLVMQRIDFGVKTREPEYDKGDIPCWSLAALLSVLPNEIITDNRFECHYQIDIRKYDGGDNTTLYQIAYGNNRGLSGSWHDMINTGEKENLIDCCYQMILRLHELISAGYVLQL